MMGLKLKEEIQGGGKERGQDGDTRAESPQQLRGKDNIITEVPKGGKAVLRQKGSH